MVSVLASSAVDHGIESRSRQTKNYKIGICCFSAKHNLFNSNFSVLISSCNIDVEKYSLCVLYAMNIQNDVIGLVLSENCKSKQMTDIIA